MRTAATSKFSYRSVLAGALTGGVVHAALWYIEDMTVAIESDLATVTVCAGVAFFMGFVAGIAAASIPLSFMLVVNELRRKNPFHNDDHIFAASIFGGLGGLGLYILIDWFVWNSSIGYV